MVCSSSPKAILRLLNKPVRVSVIALTVFENTPSPSTIVSIKLSQAPFNLLTDVCIFSIFSLLSIPYATSNAFAKLGKTSAERTSPFFIILSNSSRPTPIDAAIIPTAPGNLSPNCLLNSSVVTFPLFNICSNAK